jgi:hypothetical protein
MGNAQKRERDNDGYGEPGKESPHGTQ